MTNSQMQGRAWWLALAMVTTVGHVAVGQGTPFGPPPMTKAAVGPWDAALVRRASALLKSPAQWNRYDHGNCPDTATTFSFRCALVRVLDEGVGLQLGSAPVAKAAVSRAPLVQCEFRPVGNHREGSCGPLFEEMPIFSLSRVPAITSGAWRKEMPPVTVWSGVMWAAENQVMVEARQAIGDVSPRKYSARLLNFNNDSLTTFADLQKVFGRLQDRLAAMQPGDLAEDSGDSVEVEIYKDGTGVIRTYVGWYPVSGVTIRDSIVRFKIDTLKEVAPSSLDRAILERAATIITSDAVWDRADDRKCGDAATTWSIYCAVELAEVQVAGGFHHRRPAMELVRQIVDERTKDKQYQHRLMEYNNDKSTTLEDVRTLFVEAIRRIKP